MCLASVVVVFDGPITGMSGIRFPDSIGYVKAGRNAIVLRTFSRFMGWPVCGSVTVSTTPEMTNYLNRIVRPSAPTGMAQRAALAALDDEAHVATRSIAQPTRKWITYGQACSELGLRRCRAKQFSLFPM